MKKIAAASILLACILLQSCSKQEMNRASVPLPGQSAMDGQIINAKVSPGGIYNLNFTAPAIVTIVRQASHFTISEAKLGETSGSVNYRYSPADKFLGEDRVTLSYKSSSYSDNGGCHGGPGGNQNDATLNYVTIKINVAN